MTSVSARWARHALPCRRRGSTTTDSAAVRGRSVGFFQALSFWARGSTTNETERALAAEDVFFLPRASHPYDAGTCCGNFHELFQPDWKKRGRTRFSMEP